ncbi:MAG: fused MFS/spermidine synthase [Proteobacteria bacterium]|nr:fused MFS/spermidine synthase [Pseudomonadota bacterium]
MGRVYAGARRALPPRRRKGRVRVRDTSAGRELWVDGTFASLYRPGRATTGTVWDAIAAPIAWLPPRRRRRVLLLGLAGGSVARVVRALAPRAEIVGVEFDAAVLAAARDHFGLDALGIEVVAGDARDVLARERRRFDVVYEDVFVGAGDAVHKPAWLPDPGTTLAARRVAAGGLLVTNTLDETVAVTHHVAVLRPSVVRIDVAEYDNRIVVAGGPELDAASLRRAVRNDPVLAEVMPRLRFRTWRA